ncbi:MAG: VOC family protein [Flavobacteriales bacterium]
MDPANVPPSMGVKEHAIQGLRGVKVDDPNVTIPFMFQCGYLPFIGPADQQENTTLMIPDPRSFLTELFGSLNKHGIDVRPYELDHICYRVDTEVRYSEMKTTFREHAHLLVESMVSGRLIATYKLNESFLFEGRSITVIELPSPKSGSPYYEGYEHAEFVIDVDPLAFTERYPQLDWDLSGSRKLMNADVRLPFGSISVKFHQEALEKVIERERSMT